MVNRAFNNEEKEISAENFKKQGKKKERNVAGSNLFVREIHIRIPQCAALSHKLPKDGKSEALSLSLSLC